uniref:Ankyrin repeat domain-containing protein n=1 Tax=Wolbachia endosymbiont of Oeneis ivallda TaxID=3171168 RepID=A0AAU7YKR4_9RICK
MGIGYERLTGTACTVKLLRSSRGLSGRINCAEVSSFIYDIIAENQKDDARKLLSSSLKVRKFLLNDNLGGFVNTLRKYITGELIDNFIEQLIEKYTTEEHRKAFIQEVCEVVLDPFPPLKIAQKFSQLLNKKHVTEKSEEQQVTEVPQTTEDQQVATEVPQVTEKQQNTKKQQVMNEDGDTALHLAAMKDDLNTVKYLVEKGVEVDVKNKYGATPLHVASIRGNLEIAQFLLDHGADVNAQVVNGLTPLNWATIHDHPAIVKLLLDHCADVNIKEGESDAAYDFGYGRTPLISAVVACNTEVARLLLDNGADVSIKGRGLTALDFANTNKDKCPEMLALLKDGNIKNSDSRSHCTFTMATSSATKPSFFISSMLNWVEASTTAALSSIFQGTPALPFAQQPITYSGENSISSSQVGFGGMAFLADVATRKFTGQKYSRPLDDSLLTLEQIKERRLSAIEKDVKMAISKFEKLDQCPRSSLSSTTISKGMDYQKSF